MRRTLFFLSTLIALSSCMPHHTGATQVGIRFSKITRSVERADPGATYFFAPFVNDWKTFDVSTQSLVMSAEATAGDRSSKDDLRFKTRAGARTRRRAAPATPPAAPSAPRASARSRVRSRCVEPARF